jgi:hypothetical protein
VPAALAALARAVLRQGRIDEAVAFAEQARDGLEALGYVEDCEGLVRLAIVEALDARGDKIAAAAAVQVARARLAERAAAIQSNEWRASFLSRIPEHAQTLELARQLSSQG